jgi:predicted secreted protein
MGNKYSAFGTLLQKSSGGTSPTFATIGGVRDISGPAGSRDVIDVTAHDSPGGYEEIVPGLKRSGEVTFDIAYDPADPSHSGAASIHEAFEDGTLDDYKMVLTDPGTQEIAFSAYVVGWSHSAPVNGSQDVSVTLKPTGALVYT